jgi:hypothetical protein
LDGVRYSLGCRKHIGEARTLVIGVARAQQGLKVGEIGDEHGDASRDDGGNRQRLALHVPHVTQELAIQH